MKTKFTIAAIALALTSASAFALPGKIDSGTVQFHGNVTGVSCQISLQDGAKDGYIFLDDVNVTELQHGALVKPTYFSVDVKNCTGTTNSKLRVKWVEGDTAAQADSNKPAGFLKNETDASYSSVENVYLALATSADINDAIVVGDDGQKLAEWRNAGDDNARFGYVVGYALGDSSAVQPGTIDTHAVYEVSYE